MNKKAFTLVELIVVVIIIGLLATFAIPQYAASQRRARARRIWADMKLLAAAENIYHTETGVYAFCQIPGGNTDCNDILNLNISTPSAGVSSSEPYSCSTKECYGYLTGGTCTEISKGGKGGNTTSYPCDCKYLVSYGDFDEVLLYSRKGVTFSGCPVP